MSDWQTVTTRNIRRAPTIIPTATSLEKRVLKEDIPKLRFLSQEARQGLMRARADAKLTQRQLDAQCGFPANTVRDLEAGTLTPSPVHLRALQRSFPTVRFTVKK